VLKIYFSRLSSPANKVRMCASALDLDYESIPVDLRSGEQRAQAYLAINPFGKVPAIDDDGFFLFESNAIIKYLCRKQVSSLYPDGIESQAKVDSWCDFAASLLSPAYNRVTFNRVLAPRAGASVDENSLADGLRFIGRYLPVVDDALADNAYIAGSEMTIADIALLATLDPSEACEIELSAYPALYTWRRQLREQPFYRTVHRYYGEGVLD